MRPGVATVSADAMRTYIRRRRGLLGYTQESLASAIGMPHSTYRDFESGATQELKAGLFARIVDTLNIPLEHIKKLGREISADEAHRLAAEVLTPQDRERIKQLAASVPDDQVAEVLARIEELRSDPLALARLNSRIAALVEEQAEQRQKPTP